MINEWTAEETEKTLAMYAKGHSCSQISRALGTKSRNAVIGKIYRMTNRKERGDIAVTRSANLIANPIKRDYRKREKLSVTLPVVVSKSRELPRHTISPHTTCQWPAGEAPPYEFCGAEAKDGKPYCRSHAERAYAPTRVPMQRASAMMGNRR